ncbi:hypothetical protein JL720_13586 [Aureococcus anophagefferens]|nr:hypothetical protein JL720_13586 [Aureococcus anophagefferens]
MLPYAGIVCALEVCMVCADTACDALVVGLTKTEADARGRDAGAPRRCFESSSLDRSTLANAYSCRFTAALLSSAAIAVLYDGPKQGATCPSLSLRTWWAAGVAPAGCMLVAGVFTHVRDAERALPGRDEAALRRRGLGRFRLRGPRRTAPASAFCITSLSSLTIVLQLLKAYALHCDWRALFSSAIFGMQAFYASFLIVVWCCWARNGWFYVFLNIDNQVAYDVTFFLSVVMVPELVEPGLEGVTYGAFTTLTNAAQNVASAVSVQPSASTTARGSATRRRAGPWPTSSRSSSRLLYGATMSILPIVPATPCLARRRLRLRRAAAADDDAPGAAYCA